MLSETSMESIRYNVNKFDKKIGCNLKHPIKLAETKEDYESSLINYKTTLTYLITSINNIKFDKYVRNEGIFNFIKLKDIKLNNKFMERAILFRDDIHVESQAFKLKFMSIFIKYVIDNIDSIAKVMSRYSVKYDIDNKYLSRSYHIEELIKNISRYISNVIMEMDDDDKSLMYFNELLLIVDLSNSKQTSKVINRIKKHTEKMSDIRLFMISMDNKISSLSILIDTVLKVTRIEQDNNLSKAILCTKKLTPEIMSEILTDLGKQIIDDGMTTSFNLFIESDPVITIKLEDINNNNYLLIGVLALRYYAFISNDLNISRKVNKFINMLN